jgi:hypothetical protein
MDGTFPGYVPAHGRQDLSPLARSFRRHLRAENRAASTIATYLTGVRQAEDFLRPRRKELTTADRGRLAGRGTGDRHKPDGAHEAPDRA